MPYKTENLYESHSINQAALKGYYVATPQVVDVQGQVRSVSGWVLLPARLRQTKNVSGDFEHSRWTKNNLFVCLLP